MRGRQAARHAGGSLGTAGHRYRNAHDGSKRGCAGGHAHSYRHSDCGRTRGDGNGESRADDYARTHGHGNSRSDGHRDTSPHIYAASNGNTPSHGNAAPDAHSDTGANTDTHTTSAGRPRERAAEHHAAAVRRDAADHTAEQAGAARSMDLLEHTVRTIEEFMGEPFPVRYVGILFKDAVHATEGSAGTNFGHVIAQRARYDVDDGSRDAHWLPSLMSHEVAHYYWRGNETWIDEGAATFMEFIVENARTGAPLAADRHPCAYYDNLGELDRANPVNPGGSYWAEFGCNYSLGERLFLDLYRTLGRDQFQQGFRNLYRALKGRSVYGGIDEVEAAFKTDAGPEVVAAVDTVINRWYHGTEPYDDSHLDDGPVDYSLPSIEGRIEDAFISLDQEWPADLSSRTHRITLAELDELDGWVRLYLKFGLSITAADRAIPLTYVQYYEDGVTFRSRVVSHTFEGSRTSRWWRVSIGYSPGRKWATGTYGVMVYDGERKVAQVEYEVVP